MAASSTKALYNHRVAQARTQQCNNRPATQNAHDLTRNDMVVRVQRCKKLLQTIFCWHAFTRKLRCCIKANGGYFENCQLIFVSENLNKLSIKKTAFYPNAYFLFTAKNISSTVLIFHPLIASFGNELSTRNGRDLSNDICPKITIINYCFDKVVHIIRR